jgi:hypothetical protein
LAQAEGYAKGLGKSIFLALDLREVFELWPDKYYASGKRLKVVLKVMFFIQSGDPVRTRTGTRALDLSTKKP